MSEIKKTRDSNIELCRILMMLVIVGHHYVVKSGISENISLFSPGQLYGDLKVYFEYIFGWGGKTAINVFLLITGFFMCKQEIKWKKILFLVGEIIFYIWGIYAIFLISGYQWFNYKDLIKTIIVIPYGFGTGFLISFLALYILVPFINKLIGVLEKGKLEKLILILLVFYTVTSTFFFNNSFEYIGWYVTVYLIGSYIRLYPLNWMNSKKITGFICLLLLMMSWSSVAFIWFISTKLNRSLTVYYFVADSNKILAISTAIFIFLFFKNINIGYNKIINLFASSTLGVLLIHANSDTMRKWLWQDVCHSVDAFKGEN